jgi:hypothetical protein
MDIYWSVYKNIESECIKLMYNIYFVDEQLNVYSPRIADLIVRCAVEIESLAKQLYKDNGGTKTEHIKFDEDAIRHLNRFWRLDKKAVIISSSNCYFQKRELYPFAKEETRTNGSRKTWGWNNAYQNLKHDRANSLSWGNIKYLLDAMAALYLLNIYYQNIPPIQLGVDSMATTLNLGFGSDIFSVLLHPFGSCSIGKANETYHKKDNFENCTFFTHHNEEYQKAMAKEVKEYNDKIIELLLQNQDYTTFTDFKESYNGLFDLVSSVLGSEAAHEIHRRAAIESSFGQHNQVQYEAILNKHQI